MEKKAGKRARTGATAHFFPFLSVLTVLSLLSFAVRNVGAGRFSGEQAASRPCFSAKTAEETETCGGERERVIDFGILPVNQAASREETRLIPGGDLFGVRMEIDGLLVVKTGAVEGTGANPAAKAGIEPGDVLLSADGVPLRGGASLTKILAKSGGKEVVVRVRHGDGERDTSLAPLRDPDGVYRAGLWVREAAAGIGTVTYLDPETGLFAGLGHGVCDGETGKLLPLLRGTTRNVVATGVKRADRTAPGEIQGELTDQTAGELYGNTDTGVYGKMSTPEGHSGESVPVGRKNEVRAGKATILCQLDEEGKKAYEAVIESICDKNGETKNFILRITDKALLEKTGGIIQGMSGSPILQNGKLIGAVTHVMLRDPERGYGIFIENMLKNAKADEREEKAA